MKLDAAASLRRALRHLQRMPTTIRVEQSMHRDHLLARPLPAGRTRARYLTDDLEGDREIVRREHPDRIRRMSIARLHANRPQTVHGPELSRRRDRSERRDAGVVAPLVHDEESIRGQRGEPYSLLGVVAERFSTNTGTSPSSTS